MQIFVKMSINAAEVTETEQTQLEMTNILTRHPNLHISHPCPLNHPTGGIFCGSCLFCEWGGLRLGVCQLNPY